MSTPDALQDRRLRHLAAGKKRKPFNIIAFVIRRGPVAAIAGAALGILLAILLRPMGKPEYQADAVLLVDPSKQPTLSGRERDTIPGNLGDWTRTQISRITGPDVLADAIARIDPAQRPEFLSPDPADPANVFRLMKRVRVKEVPRTYLVTLSIRDEAPHGIAEALNAVLEAFVQKLEDERKAAYSARMEYLHAERTKISARLEQEEARLMELANSVESKAFLHEGYNVHLTKVDQIQRLYWEAYARATEADANLARTQRDRDAVLAMDLKPFADERVADNFGINRIEQWTYEQLQQMRASIDGLTPDNQDRKYVESRMDSMNQYLTAYKGRVNDETILNLGEKRRFQQDELVLFAENAAKAARETAAHLQSRLEAARLEAAATSLAIFSASGPSFLRTQLRDRLQALNTRIDDAEMEAKAPLPVQIDKLAMPPDRPASSSTNTLMLLGLVAGLGIVGAALLLYELLDDRLRASREIELALGGPGPDPITAFVSDVGEHPAFIRALLDTPDHPASAAIRDLAVRVLHDHQRHGGKLYSLAGLQPRAGVTSLAVNLAQALRSLGGPVLLMELSFVRPGLRQALDLGTCSGMESFLRGETSIEDIIRRDPERRIDVICAEDSGRPASFERLHEILARLRGDYEVILIDAGALPEDIACLATRAADGVVLVARHKQSLFSDLRRAIDLLIQAEVPALTAVLTFSRRRSASPFQNALRHTIATLSTTAARLLHRKRV
jgi:Mrp family chromosome partitioning ATPase/uncharacterized protein involved in exopolysaccharide biosynthesis